MLDKEFIEHIKSLSFLMTKRFLDILGSLLLIALLLPLMLLISLLIRISSPGPSVYCQRRLTDNQKVFTIFKFRTMNTDAEFCSGAIWAGEDDPRITPIGRILRKTRLDELPQLLNVLIGDMSLIGPRPERPEIAQKLSQQFPSFRKRMKVKSGITGLAQVCAGYAASEEDYKLKLAYDLLYIKKFSIKLDLWIAIKTVIVVITGKGAR